jgi:hypothetical protein
MFCLIYFGSQFFLESTRYDEAIYVGPFRLAQLFDLVLALGAAVGLLWLWWRARGEEPAPDEGGPVDGMLEESAPRGGAEAEDSEVMVIADADQGMDAAEAIADKDPVDSGAEEGDELTGFGA